jgi:hypothetical protein
MNKMLQSTSNSHFCLLCWATKLPPDGTFCGSSSLCFAVILTEKRLKVKVVYRGGLWSQLSWCDYRASCRIGVNDLRSLVWELPPRRFLRLSRASVEGQYAKSLSIHYVEHVWSVEVLKRALLCWIVECRRRPTFWMSQSTTPCSTVSMSDEKVSWKQQSIGVHLYHREHFSWWSCTIIRSNR